MRKIHIVMYHYTRDLKNSSYPKIKGLDISLFEQQLSYFQNRFHVIRMEDVLESINSNSELPDNALLLTFDDGYIDNYLYALPLLRKFNMQGSFFIPGKAFKENTLLDVNKIHFILASSDEHKLLKDVNCMLDYYRGEEWNYPTVSELYEKYAVGDRFDSKDIVYIKQILQTVLPEDLRKIITSELFKKYVGIEESKFAKEIYLNYNQIKEMKKSGMYIGLHGYDHYWLANLDKSTLLNDINKSIEAMSEFIEEDNWVMNYPYGSYNDEVINVVQNRGCKAGLTTDVRVADLDMNSQFMLPRLDCNDFPPKSNNWINIK